MMTEIKYNICFYSEWHCSSGLSAGADMDVMVIRDKEGLPYIPGKTIKGLVRDAVSDLLFFTYGDEIPDAKSELFEKTFGYMYDDERNRTAQGTAFFTNAVIPKETASVIRQNNAVAFLFRDQSFTAIGGNGVASDHSLRVIEKVIPCELEGSIIGVDKGISEEIQQGMRMIRRLGMDRNRGLGRCSFIINSIADDEKESI